MRLLEAQQIVIRYAARIIIDGMDIMLQRGELVGLIGPNGVGKSTLLKGLLGLIPVDGAITLKGQPLSAYAPRSLSQCIGYMPQAGVVHWPISVGKVVSLGRLPHLSPWQRVAVEDQRCIDTAMREAEIEHLKGRDATKISGGERRLVMLARALAGTPEVLLADEPVSGLDPNHQLQVMGLLRQRARKGDGVMVVLHDLALAARYCDRLYLLNQGKVLAHGSPRKVLSGENLKKAYDITVKTQEAQGQFFLVPWEVVSNQKRKRGRHET